MSSDRAIVAGAAPDERAFPGDAFLRGQRLYLRRLRESDADGGYPGWFNDAEVCRGNSHHVHPYSSQDALEYIRRTIQRRDELVLAVVLRRDDLHIGNIALQAIHPIHRSAEFAIVLGERSAWGCGYGLEAGELLCRHGFQAMNLRRIGCGTFEDNVAMRKLAVALGMVEEGRRRSAAFKAGRYVDVVEYGVLQEEFANRSADTRAKEVGHGLR
jgi:RimJ/RimL family protein N-acetyltransferase